MGNINGFEIKDGVLKKYRGPGGDVVIPEGVTSIEKYAFYECNNLDSIVIPESVTSIGEYAFYGCRCLGSIVIPGSVKDIGNCAFWHCGHLTSVELRKGIRRIGYLAFSGCYSLKSIIIPDGVKTIDDSVLSECRSLESVVIPEGVTAIKGNAFNGCSNLLNIVIPASVKRIEYEAFCGCSSLTTIEIPQGVVELDDATFSGCTRLESVLLPASLTSISSEAFKGCTSLTEVLVPDCVTFIGSEAFKLCSSLTKVVLPESINHIGPSAFEACHELESFTVSGSNEFIKQNIFGQVMPSKLLSQVASLYRCMTDGSIKKYLLDKKVWKDLPVSLQAEIYLARQSKTLSPGYLQCIDNAEELGVALFERLKGTLSLKECNIASDFMLQYHDKMSAVLLKRFYGAIHSMGGAKKALSSIENCKDLMDKIESAKQYEDVEVIEEVGFTVAEIDTMYRAYLRGLLRQLEKLNSAMESKDYTEAKEILTGLIEDTKADIQDCKKE